MKLKTDLYKTTQNEKGMSLYEALFALAMISGLFLLVINVYSAVVDKSTSITAGKSIITGELNISEWLEKDYKENKVESFEVKQDSEGHPTTIVMTVSTPITGDTSQSTPLHGEDVKASTTEPTDTTRDITYRNRANGYYRISGKTSIRLFDTKIVNIIQKENLLKLTYLLNGNEKTIKFTLDK